jgi:hypothetical protein
MTDEAQKKRDQNRPVFRRSAPSEQGQLKSTSADWQPYRFYGTSSAGIWRHPSADGWPHVLSHRSHAADHGIEGLYNLSDEQLSDDGNCCNCRLKAVIQQRKADGPKQLSKLSIISARS